MLPDGNREWADADFENPIICGFDNGKESFDYLSSLEKDDSCYQHSEVRQNFSPVFKKTYDVYSLGVVLLELCLWTTITRILEDSRFEGEGNLADAMEESSPLYRSVQRNAGNNFAIIIRDCLRGTASFCLDTEDDQLSEETGSQIQKQYYQKVIKSLKALVSALSAQSQEELPPTHRTLTKLPALLPESMNSPAAYLKPAKNSDSAPPISRLPLIKKFLSDPSAYYQRLELMESKVIELSSFASFFQPNSSEVGTWGATALLGPSVSDLQSREAIEALQHYNDQHLNSMHTIQECLELLREGDLFEFTFNLIITAPIRQSVSRVVPISAKMINFLVEAMTLAGRTTQYHTSTPDLSVD